MPLTDMIGGGPFSLVAGKWTDDTSMALCLAESLIARGGFDARDQMGRYLNWWKWGYLSSTGSCFDIGNTVRQALIRFEQSGDPWAGSTDSRSAGNGSLMRLAPAVLFCHPSQELVIDRSADSSRTTHGAAEAIECCVLLGLLLSTALTAVPKHRLLRVEHTAFAESSVRTLADGQFLDKAREEITGSGYCVESLEAALWCFHHTTTFEAAVLEAANLGDDADTTAAIVGQLAGAHYGVSGIPAHWLARLYMRDDIEAIADGLLKAATRR